MIMIYAVVVSALTSIAVNVAFMQHSKKSNNHGRDHLNDDFSRKF